MSMRRKERESVLTQAGVLKAESMPRTTQLQEWWVWVPLNEIFSDAVWPSKPWSELRFPPLPLALVQCFAWLWVISSLSWQETQNWAGSSLSPKQRECLGWHLSNLFHLRHVTEPMNISRTEAGLHSQSRGKENPSWRNALAQTMV